MNLELLKNSNSIIFEVVSGSHAYGTNTPTSDLDIRGIFRLPKESYNSIIHPPQEVGDEKQDIKYYELKKYIDLVKDCNPNILELLWTPQDCIRICTPVAKHLIENRKLFITKKAYHTHIGYAHAQIEKARGKNKKVHNPQPKERPTHEDFCFYLPIGTDHTFAYTKEGGQTVRYPARPIPIKKVDINLKEFHCARVEQTANLYRLYYYGPTAKGVFRGDNMLTSESIPIEDENSKFAGLMIYNPDLYEKSLKDWHSYWDWIKNRNESRWVDQEKGVLNYDAKNLMHCVRLVLSGKHIFEKGEPIIRFEGETLEFLKKVRKGDFPYDEIMKYVTDQMAELEKLYQSSTLPWGADIQKVDKLYQELVNMS